jgi:hypothetical protein
MNSYAFLKVMIAANRGNGKNTVYRAHIILFRHPTRYFSIIKIYLIQFCFSSFQTQHLFDLYFYRLKYACDGCEMCCSWCVFICVRVSMCTFYAYVCTTNPEMSSGIRLILFFISTTLCRLLYK